MKVIFIIYFLLSLVDGDQETERPKFDMNEFVPLNYGEIWGFTQVKGFSDTSKSGRRFYSYQGIPFAEPPVGDLRLKDPVLAEPWQGTRDALEMPKPCIQVKLQNKVPDVIGSEDCLYLNVYTSKPKNKTAKLPVMVFIHGGGFSSGGAKDYTPNVIMDKDVVLVIIQYRLGTLGFISTGDSVIPGNFGLKDQTLALQWVQKHIEGFGGDPKSVTIFGESAGAASCHYQMLTPYAKGLFKRVILQSGNVLSPWAYSDTHKEVAFQLGEYLQCVPKETSQDLLECFQRYSRNTITLAAVLFNEALNWPRVFVPCTDGDYIPDEPAALVVSGKHHQVELMAGCNKDEGALYTSAILSSDDNLFHEDPIKAFSYIMGYYSEDKSEEVTTQVLEHFLDENKVNLDNANKMCRMLSFQQFMHPHDVVSSHFNINDNKLYLYELHHRGKISFTDLYRNNISSNWVSHADDLFYLFDEAHSFPTMTDSEDLKIRDIMLNTWVNFATYGNPTPDDFKDFTWRQPTKDALQYLRITTSPFMEENNRSES